MNPVALEQIRTRTLLGVRFWDRLTNAVIADGLQVTAQRLSADLTQRLGHPVVGRATPSGTIAFFGLTATERPAETDPDLWDASPPPQWIAVEMVDLRSRFLPMSFIAQTPFRGVFSGQATWLATDLLRPATETVWRLGVQLWSSPMRPVPPGRAMMRAQLVVGEGMTPAAYSLVQVSFVPPPPDEELPEEDPPEEEPLPPPEFGHYGLADAQGNLALPMPYPQVPFQTSYPSLQEQRFALAISVQYDPNLYNPEQLRSQGRVAPDLEALLQQSAADVVSDWTVGEPLTVGEDDLFTPDLRFGEPLILRTTRTADGASHPESVLRILPRPPGAEEDDDG